MLTKLTSLISIRLFSHFLVFLSHVFIKFERFFINWFPYLVSLLIFLSLIWEVFHWWHNLILRLINFFIKLRYSHKSFGFLFQSFITELGDFSSSFHLKLSFNRQLPCSIELISKKKSNCYNVIFIAKFTKVEVI